MSNTRIKRIDLLYSLFNEKLFGEAKSNIEIVSSYFRANDKDNKIVMSLLGFLDRSDYVDITPSKMKYELEKIDTLLDEEISNILSRIKYFIKLEDDEILSDYAEKLKSSCISQAMKNAQAEAGDDIIKYFDLMQKFDYKSTYSDSMSFVKFKDIDVEQAMNDNYSKFADSDLSLIGEAYPSVGGWLSSQMIMVVGQPGAGKSLFMMRTALELCKKGKKGLYVALGDLSPASFIIRMGAQLTEISLTEAARRSIYCYDGLKKEIGDNLLICCVPADKITIEKFLKKVLSVINTIDFLCVDYDANFKRDRGTQLYLEGGEIYGALSTFTIDHHKLVFVGCQPKQSYWYKSILPMSAGGESSRKQQFIDGMITIGYRNMFGLPMGYLAFPKNRNGKAGVYKPYIRTSDGNFHIVSSEVYNSLKDVKDLEEISWFELQQIENKHSEKGAMMKDEQLTKELEADPEVDKFFESNNDAPF